MKKSNVIRIHERTYLKLRSIGEEIKERTGFKPTITDLINYLTKHYGEAIKTEGKP